MSLAVTDYLAISDTKARYCRCLDTKDWDGFADVFMPDLVLDTRPSGGTEVAAAQPQFGPDGALWFAADESGFFTIHRDTGAE